jgi:hypothetical protein
MNFPPGSNFCDCVTGLKIRNQGCASQPVDADHCQPPLLAARSKSFSSRANQASPRRQERSGDHAQTVVHVAALVQLPHRGIHQRIPGAAFAPRLEVPRRILKRQRVEVAPEGLADHVREVVQDAEVELAPDEFR